jgi:hypothetical protein
MFRSLLEREFREREFYIISTGNATRLIAPTLPEKKRPLGASPPTATSIV